VRTAAVRAAGLAARGFRGRPGGRRIAVVSAHGADYLIASAVPQRAPRKSSQRFGPDSGRPARRGRVGHDIAPGRAPAPRLAAGRAGLHSRTVSEAETPFALLGGA